MVDFQYSKNPFGISVFPNSFILALNCLFAVHIVLDLLVAGEPPDYEIKAGPWTLYPYSYRVEVWGFWEISQFTLDHISQLHLSPLSGSKYCLGVRLP